MILKIIGYWLILLILSYANMRFMWEFEYTWNYEAFKQMSWSGGLYRFILYSGPIVLYVYLFITFTEWWFDFNLPLY